MKLPPEVEARKQELAEKYAVETDDKFEFARSWAEVHVIYSDGFDAAWAIAQERIAEIHSILENERRRAEELLLLADTRIAELEQRVAVLQDLHDKDAVIVDIRERDRIRRELEEKAQVLVKALEKECICEHIKEMNWKTIVCEPCKTLFEYRGDKND